MQNAILAAAKRLIPFQQPILITLPPEVRTEPMVKFEIFRVKFISHQLELLGWGNQWSPMRFKVTLRAATSARFQRLVALSTQHVADAFGRQCDIEWHEQAEDVLKLCA